MRHWMLVGLMTIGGVAGLAHASEALTLGEAIDKGLVQAEIRGVSGMTGEGTSSGDAIEIKVRNISGRAVTLSLPAGTVLNSANPGVQNMVVHKVHGVKTGPITFYPASEIRLNVREGKEYLVLAYCLDWDKDNPTASTTFRLGAKPDPDIHKIMTTLDRLPRNRASIAAVQIAIWAVTSPSLTTQELEARFQASAEDIATARFIIEKAGVPLAGKRIFAP